jgi:hypothetical protein
MPIITTRIPVGRRYALPISVGAAMVSLAAAGFAAGYELVNVGGGLTAARAGERRKALAPPGPPRR